MRGPRDVKAFVEEKGGAIRLFREMAPPPGRRGRQKTGEILIKLGRIREIFANGTEIDKDEDDRPPTTPTTTPSNPRPEEIRRNGGGGPGKGGPPHWENDTSSEMDDDSDDDDKGRRGRPPWAGRPNEVDFEVKNET